MIKKIKFPNAKEEFNELAYEAEKKFKGKKITTKDVEEAIRWSRG